MIRLVRIHVTDDDAREMWVGRLKQARRVHDVTKNGVPYHWELAGPAGADFFLFQEEGTTDEAMQLAGRHIRAEHDCLKLYQIDMRPPRPRQTSQPRRLREPEYAI